MNAFIVRPFGEKDGINFDKVEADLIRPALNALKIPGGTTGLLAYAGNIRTDMFEQLLLADLVVADISIHNANVFYELGVRHGLRDQRTFLIRCKGDEVPFDLKTDRYLEYDRSEPADTLAQLIEGLRQTIDSHQCDSPVFSLLPKLQPPAREALLTVPEGFELEVRRALAAARSGDVAMLTAETDDLNWQVEGLRVAGRALFKLKTWKMARRVWDQVLRFHHDDIEADLLLGTIYERLSDLAASDQALERVLRASVLTPWQRAEAYALLGRNAKTRWQESWKAAPSPAATALQSNYLKDAYVQYDRGFSEDQNHFYSGLNALGILVTRVELARALEDTWNAMHDSDELARTRLVALEIERTKLASAVERSLKAARDRLDRIGGQDIWLDISEADFKCLTVQGAPRAAAAYNAILARAKPFEADAARRQLELYQKLGVLSENVMGALAIFPVREKKEENKTPHIILFTGHMIDAHDREKPRFPASKEGVARALIREKLEAVCNSTPDEPKLGLAGAASGGDILFHEVCAELGIPTDVYLALPEEAFKAESVTPAGGDWNARFDCLLKGKNKDEVRRLAENREMPKWLREKKPKYSIWERNNLWMLYNALALDGKHTTLIALWDGEGGDGPGGTRDMVQQAQELGAQTIIIDTKKEFGL